MLTCFTAATFCLVGMNATAAQKPNIIFIMADDLGYGELGCYGQHRYLYFRMGNKKRIIRGKAETRTDEEIDEEANTDVVVPKFTRSPVTPRTIPTRPLLPRVATWPQHVWLRK